ncbi:MAG: ParB/RepB/Spo0J family partition protein [Hyphomicrobiaceae bacterium]|jgi:ParB family chromosome partitioning protein
MARKTKSTGKQKAKAPPVSLHPVRNIPLQALRLSPANVRTIYEVADIADLADSIAQRGLLQSLSVREHMDGNGKPTGTYEVQAGGRRFRALQALVAAGRLEADAAIPCILKSEGLAEDDSLAENTDRQNLHPLDEYRAFAAMRAKGMTDEAIAAAYRVTPAFVRQRLRLASASPAVLQAFADGELDMDELVAFCVTEDHARQDAVFQRIRRGEIQAHAHIIRQSLTEDTVRSTDLRVKFVGVEAYEAAGGALLRDLFADDRAYLQDPDLLNRLVSEKLEVARAEQVAKGWKWAEAAVSFDYGNKSRLDRLIPLDSELTLEEQARYNALEAERDRLAEADELTDAEEERFHAVENELEAIDERPPVYAADDMARAGVFLSISHSGELMVDEGYVRPEDRVQEHVDPETGEITTSPVGSGTHTSGDGQAEEPEEDDETGTLGKPLADSLQQDLTSFRTVAIRKALGEDFDTAFLAMLHVLVTQHFYHGMSASCLQVTAQRAFPASAPGLDSWDTTLAVDRRDREFRKLLPENYRDLWAALVRMDDDGRRQLFAHCAAGTVNAVKARHSYRGDVLPHADQLVSELGMTMTGSGWTTRADNYFGRVTKAHILEAVTEAKGESTANLIAHLKKDAMAMEAERLVADIGWLPQLLRAPADATPAPVEENDALPAFLADGGDAEPAAA